MLVGRDEECRKMQELADGVRAGKGGCLVIRGEPGIGKTKLLKYLAHHSSGCRVERALGVESEMEIAFAGLHQLCRSMFDSIQDLPAPQRDAINVNIGRRSGTPPDRLMVGLATLGLLSETARKRPLICLVDDAQWLDHASLGALAFVARRLGAEPILLVFAVREPGLPELRGLPELVVTALCDREARALLASAIRGPMDPQIRDQIIAESHGNPLALLELPQGQTPVALAGGFSLPEAWPLKNRIERNFLARFQALPEATQRLLLTAAAEPVGDVPLLWRAAKRQGITHADALPAQDAGLLALVPRVRFRHPLVRSAIYKSATASDRQAVHRALAEATDPEADPDRRAWHRAQAATGPDEEVACELLHSAERARDRGGAAAAAAFLQRATDLTPDSARRAGRALATAEAMLDAANPDVAYDWAAIAEIGPLDALQHARLTRLRAEIAFAQRHGSDAPALLCDAARILEPVDLPSARETCFQAFGAAIFAGRMIGNGVGMLEIAQYARGLPPSPEPARPLDLLLDGLTARYTKGYAAAVPILREALHAYCRAARCKMEPRRLRVAGLIAPAVAADLWDDETYHDLATSGIRLARETGALAILPWTLGYRAGVHVAAGEFAAAAALVDEANAITESTGLPQINYAALFLLANQGKEDEALERFRDARRDATTRCEGITLGVAHCATAILLNGCGEYERALESAMQGAEYEDLGIISWTFNELIEAAARSGKPEQAAFAMQELEERARASNTDWARGILARSRALLSDDQAAEALYREAIERLARTRMALHLARAHLVYGEWLRRQRRPTEARTQLRTAHEAFTRFGAEAFAERARRELLATGETVAKHDGGSRHPLTAQEEQIARLASEGHTNAEIGSQLFISPRTAEWHLRHVYTKLDIASRKELRAALEGVTFSPGDAHAEQCEGPVHERTGGDAPN